MQPPRSRTVQYVGTRVQPNAAQKSLPLGFDTVGHLSLFECVFSFRENHIRFFAVVL